MRSIFLDDSIDNIGMGGHLGRMRAWHKREPLCELCLKFEDGAAGMQTRIVLSISAAWKDVEEVRRLLVLMLGSAE